LKETEKMLKDAETTFEALEKSTKETCLALERAGKELAEQAKIQNEIAALQKAISEAQTKKIEVIFFFLKSKNDQSLKETINKSINEIK